MNKADNSTDQIVSPQTKVFHENEWGYIEVTKKPSFINVCQELDS